jgi:hypothetical protein
MQLNGFFRYLKGTIKYSITFVRQKSDLSVVEYINVDYAGDMDDRRSTMGYIKTHMLEVYDPVHGCDVHD